ncbi:hypothetical protein EDD53_2099 [Pacificibacter maritimus]|uniref:Sensory transduction regulator n=1 Tax=Pacificibacter maritimus TaxID=762213 RepID=A0A3N4UMW6_9RHOB|nr:YbjN domain-containing protein [Pacificibacter maritimus]RPE66397.1 hypothetical protein EDD53_2099 [Pacificibacter maritimus]
MSLNEPSFSEDLHPIDLVEHLALTHEWEFDRVGDDQISMAVEGQWRTYSITLAWSDYDETLRLISTFDMDPPAERLPQMFEVLNHANDECWTGSFTYWQDQRLMVFRYGLSLDGGQVAVSEQVDRMINSAVAASERFYPAFQLVAWAERDPKSAMDIAIREAYGRA